MMIESSGLHRSPAFTAVSGLLLFDTVALLLAATVHAIGVRIALGGGSFDERQIIPASIVEGLAGIIFAASVYAVIARKTTAWRWAVFAHGFAIAGFLLGVWATSRQSGPDSQFNFVYHRVMLGIFAVGLALLLTPAIRATFPRSRG